MITYATEIALSGGAGRSDHSTSNPTLIRGTVGEFAANLAATTERKGTHYVTPGYRPGAKPGEPYPRREVELEQADWLGFDFDEATAEQIRSALEALDEAGLAYLATTTYSHTPEQPRIRVFMFMARPVGPAAYRATWKFLANEFETHGLIADTGPSHIASVLYIGQRPDPAMPWRVGFDWRDDIQGSRGLTGREGLPVQPRAPDPPPIRSSQRASAAGARPATPGARSRAAAYFDAVPSRATSTPELYARFCRAGDLAETEGEMREACLVWATRTQPLHSTGELQSERDITRVLACAVKYRQTSVGGGR